MLAALNLSCSLVSASFAMKPHFVLLVLFLCFFLIPFLILRKLKNRYPQTFEQYYNVIYSAACLLLSGIFGVQGVTVEDMTPSLVTLSGFAFFATSFVFTLHRNHWRRTDSACCN